MVGTAHPTALLLYYSIQTVELAACIRTVAWTPRPSENQLETVGRGVHPTVLHGGERRPTVEPHPAGDDFAFVSRVERRPQAEVYSWTLAHPLPPIPIPLTDGDPDVTLDLQTVFTTTYDRAGYDYDYALHYERPVDPPLEANQLHWAGQHTGRAAT